MANTILVGAQWGDEGKGKIIDVLTEKADVVVRSQGGSNAGHTVLVDDEKYILHLLPSGILRKGKACVIGNGVVIDPISLVAEIDEQLAKGVSITPRNLRISETAHIVLPYHKEVDGLKESLKGKRKIGTTKRGIGPTYSDKASRSGLRMIDLIQPKVFAGKFRLKAVEDARQLRSLGSRSGNLKQVEADYLAAGKRLRPFVTNTAVYLDGVRRARKQILFEGAQGTFLDIDFGTYPYVTSSNTTSGGACTGSGFPPNRIDAVIGVAKAYTTRVGEGPFPTEDTFLSDLMHGMGREYGATTGRARRCGWFDAVVVSYAAMINGIDRLAVTCIDGLDTLETIKVCVAYKLDGRTVKVVPCDLEQFSRCKPVYRIFKGWKKDISKVRQWKDLPPQARTYLTALAELTGTKLGIVSVGPNRAQTLFV
ncbi:MAG: adenylosuccinate synthase [Verrucomicrobiae bacterium]|nr:adenylosuccinate synthase [Verrucomicrobiae bacterium]